MVQHFFINLKCGIQVDKAGFVGCGGGPKDWIKYQRLNIISTKLITDAVEDDVVAHDVMSFFLKFLQ